MTGIGRRFGAMVAGAAIALGAAGAVAKPHDIRLQIKSDFIVAIHTPTGCVASVELDDGVFVRAWITDALCLPRGVAKAPVPGEATDFYALDASEAALIGRR